MLYPYLEMVEDEDMRIVVRQRSQATTSRVSWHPQTNLYPGYCATTGSLSLRTGHGDKLAGFFSYQTRIAPLRWFL